MDQRTASAGSSTKRFFYITHSGPRATRKEIEAAMRAQYDRLETAFSDMGGGLIFDSTGDVIAFHERHEDAVERTGARMEAWPLTIARDFDYTDPRGLVLDVIRRGIKERWIYPTVKEAHAAHAELRESGAEYLPTNAQHSGWIGADVKFSSGARAGEMSA